MAKHKDLATKVLVAAMGAESGVTLPPRTRSSSFASMVSDLEEGDAPAARTFRFPVDTPLEHALAGISDESERLRNAVTSSVAQAKRKNPGREFSIETTQLVTKSGLFVIALVTRTV